MKKLIISADDFGYSKEINRAIISGIKDGIITATAIMANMPAFDEAIEMLPGGFDIGVHFNIVEGKALRKKSILCDNDGNFTDSYAKILFFQNDKKYLNDIEAELRAQIEKVSEYRKITHLDSHRHYSSIPNVFKIFLKAAKEYDIPFVRTQKEPFFIVPQKIFNRRFPLNIIKHLLLNFLSGRNINEIKNTEIRTNDELLGVLYTGYTDTAAVFAGLNRIKSDVTELIIHPYLPDNLENTRFYNYYKEFLITKTPGIKENIQKAGFQTCGFSEL